MTISGTCDFEHQNICGWKEWSTGRFKWQSHQGKSPGKFSPPRDHTLNSDIGKNSFFFFLLVFYFTYVSSIDNQTSDVAGLDLFFFFFVSSDFDVTFKLVFGNIWPLTIRFFPIFNRYKTLL